MNQACISDVKWNFLFWNHPKDLDPFCEMYLDIWDCFRRKILGLITIWCLSGLVQIHLLTLLHSELYKVLAHCECKRGRVCHHAFHYFFKGHFLWLPGFLLWKCINLKGKTLLEEQILSRKIWFRWGRETKMKRAELTSLTRYQNTWKKSSKL